jgi:hypothetical protein
MTERRRTTPVRRLADFGFKIATGDVAEPSHIKISVEEELGRFELPAMVLRSSDRRAPIIVGERWPVGARWSIDDRLRHDGARKGRVLAVWQGNQVVAACPWHLHESGPPVIFDLIARNDLHDDDAKRLITALMLCLRQIAATPRIERDTTSLRWTDLAAERIGDRRERERVRRAIQSRARAAGFGTLRRPPKWLTGHWAVARQF